MGGWSESSRVTYICLILEGIKTALTSPHLLLSAPPPPQKRAMVLLFPPKSSAAVILSAVFKNRSNVWSFSILSLVRENCRTRSK